MDQRNLLVAIAASIAILLGFQFLYEQPRQRAAAERAAQERALVEQNAPPAAAGASTPTPGAATTPGSSVPGSSVPGGTTPGASGAVPTAPSIAAAVPETRIQVRSDGMHGTISTTGARIDDITLPRYRETTDPNSPEIRLLTPLGRNDAYYAMFGWTAASGEGAPVPTQDTVWQADATTLGTGKPVDLSWDNGQGVKFGQTIGIDNDAMFTVRRTVRNDSEKPVTLHPWGFVNRDGTPHTAGNYILFEGPVGVVDGVLKEHSYDDLKKNGHIEARSTGGWLGITDKYWLVALLPDQQRPVKTKFAHNMAGAVDKYQVDWLGDAVTIEPGQSLELTDHLFVGAKRVELLKRYENELGVAQFDMAVDWGWFWFLTKPIFWLLEQLFRLVGNFGLAIMALTVIVKLAFFPLANKSYRAMSAMKKLQPMMTELKERFGDDRQKLNEEMMQLYRREKINPAAGCLPIVVQIPVFFSLYKVLFVTIEMRHAPFFGWIRDLSAPDPTTIVNLFGLIPWDVPTYLHLGAWPIIMGITMFLQMKLNPQPADPIQAKVFMFMPIIFTIMLRDFAAGLVIYWAWNNTLSIIQQWAIMRTAGEPRTKPPAPAAKAK